MEITPNFIEAFYKVAHRKEIPDFLKQWNLNTNICEIGVEEGKNFKCLLSSNPKMLCGIDIWQKRRFKHCFDDMKQLEASDKRVKIIKDFSVNAVKDFEDNFFDYVYIDADHSYEAVSQDTKWWYRKVKIGGILAGHDYMEDVKVAKRRRIDGVKKAVDELIKENNIKYFHLTSEKFSYDDARDKREFASWMIIKET